MASYQDPGAENDSDLSGNSPYFFDGDHDCPSDEVHGFSLPISALRRSASMRSMEIRFSAMSQSPSHSPTHSPIHTVKTMRVHLSSLKAAEVEKEEEEARATRRRWRLGSIWTSMQKACKKARQQQFEFKDLALNDLAEQVNGRGAFWEDLSVQQQVELIKKELTSSGFILNPTSDYMKVWDVIMAVALLFTAIVTSYEIAFLETQYNALYALNRCLDALFVKDMLLQFVLMVKKKSVKGTTWVYNKRGIAKAYLKGWFAVDVLAILPYDYLPLLVSGEQETYDATSLENLRAMRMLRVLRSIKLLRILKGTRIVKRWENRIGMMSGPKYLLKFTVLILVSCHWLACIWGFCGILYGTNLECRERLRPTDPRLDTFPDTAYFFRGPDPSRGWVDQWDGHSWVVRFADGRTASTPMNPCDSHMVYAASLYWSIQTMTSVGYGDIIPTTPFEYVICSICMMASSILWAYIIGAAGSIMSTAHPEQIEFEQAMDAFNQMARDQELPDDISVRGRGFLREQRYHKRHVRSRDAAQCLSADLKGIVNRKMSSYYLDHISFFQGAELTQLREDVANEFEASFYEKREIVKLHGRLCVVERGAVGYAGRILVPWAYWGEDMVVTNERLRKQEASVSLTYLEVVSLSREDLFTVLAGHPDQLCRFKRVAVKYAMLRAAQIYLEENYRCDFDPANSWIHALIHQLNEGRCDSQAIQAQQQDFNLEGGAECGGGKGDADRPYEHSILERLPEATIINSIKAAVIPIVEDIEMVQQRVDAFEYFIQHRPGVPDYNETAYFAPTAPLPPSKSFVLPPCCSVRD
mmetsp:Transcript_30072/g.82593  ORF Transcript_30072/g.82593 Transcript_30072/m.82593 type:complete len:811 (-) Transcript_30072:107-2539(-)